MRSGILDRNNKQICDGDIVIYRKRHCQCEFCSEYSFTRLKVKFEYGSFYLLPLNKDTIYDIECSTHELLTLAAIVMRTDDHGDGYNYYLPERKSGALEVVE
jgi:hypothetical protein